MIGMQVSMPDTRIQENWKRIWTKSTPGTIWSITVVRNPELQVDTSIDNDLLVKLMTTSPPSVKSPKIS